jgi:hypothetical protein
VDADDDLALFHAPPGRCPKCVAPVAPEALACRACGLVFSNWVPEALAIPPAVEASWRRLQARWGERAAHDALLLAAQGGGHLAVVGRLYRIRLARQPGDLEADRALKEIVRLALLPGKAVEEGRRREQQEPQGQKRAVRLALAVLVLLLCLAALALLLRAA